MNEWNDWMNEMNKWMNPLVALFRGLWLIVVACCFGCIKTHRTFVAIEYDMLQGNKLMAKLTLKCGKACLSKRTHTHSTIHEHIIKSKLLSGWRSWRRACPYQRCLGSRRQISQGCMPKCCGAKRVAAHWHLQRAACAHHSLYEFCHQGLACRAVIVAAVLPEFSAMA